jgi:hypothetical protein
MSEAAGWMIPLWFITFGALLVGSGLFLLAEYRRLFFASPREAMSWEVLLQLLFHPASTPALLGALVLFIGLWFFVIGLIIATFMLSMVARDIGEYILPHLLEQVPLFGGSNVR